MYLQSCCNGVSHIGAEDKNGSSLVFILGRRKEKKRDGSREDKTFTKVKMAGVKTERCLHHVCVHAESSVSDGAERMSDQTADGLSSWFVVVRHFRMPRIPRRERRHCHRRPLQYSSCCRAGWAVWPKCCGRKKALFCKGYGGETCNEKSHLGFWHLVEQNETFEDVILASGKLMGIHSSFLYMRFIQKITGRLINN